MATELQSRVSELESNICHVVLGKRDVVRLCLVGLLSGEHILLEDVPGVGKTLVGKALAKSIHGNFCRLQFTPDLLPSDITGAPILQDAEGGRKLQFQPGPIFANLMLADEINRATPKTQAALLEAMQERRVTVLGESHPLPSPFFVLATQNPIDRKSTRLNSSHW